VKLDRAGEGWQQADELDEEQNSSRRWVDAEEVVGGRMGEECDARDCHTTSAYEPVWAISNR